MLKPGDTVMGMNLAEGGHLTHGSPVNISGAYYHFVAYGVDPVTHQIDYDKLYEQAMQAKPKLIVAGASAYPRTIDFKRFRELQMPAALSLWSTWRTLRGLSQPDTTRIQCPTRIS